MIVFVISKTVSGFRDKVAEYRRKNDRELLQILAAKDFAEVASFGCFRGKGYFELQGDRLRTRQLLFVEAFLATITISWNGP